MWGSAMLARALYNCKCIVSQHVPSNPFGLVQTSPLQANVLQRQNDSHFKTDQVSGDVWAFALCYVRVEQ